MNPLVELRSVGSAQLWPTRKQKEAAEADIVSLYRARLEGFQRDLLRRLQEAGVLQNTATAEKSGTVSEASSANSASSSTGVVSRAGGELGKDAFLQLLVTQMQYQDPLSPMDNTDMIAQLAQFSALEQMNNLNATTQSGMSQLSSQMATLSLLGAQNLIGRTVSGLAADTNATVSGRVIGVSLEE
ncbi:MAG TPA: flagellar hook assembly protein FlgD, partial [Candidatus Hydrogenedentes bacterium]|nr:flagellar hook assembly protein FlgD [Candidatus Hydrogenedentota bacterium]